MAQTDTADGLTEMFVYLDELRESGEANMFGASPYLQSEFFLGKKAARDVLSEWMRTFSRDTPAATRAALSITTARKTGGQP